MGLPDISIKFETLASSAIKRSENGIVAILIKDSEATSSSYIFTNFSDVKSSDFSSTNYDYIRLVFEGKPFKVLVEVVEEELGECLTRLINKKFNYLCYPEAQIVDNTAIKSWILEQRKNNRMKKAVLANTAGDDEGIINFTTSGIKVDSKTYSASDYTTRIAGILAGLPATRSATYFVLDEVEEITESSTPDADIDGGKLILINDGRKIKIARGVNSLVTTNNKKSEDFKKIKIVEAMDLMLEDIKNTFEDEYVGKVNNSYDNKCLLVSSINAYFTQLQRDDILDHNNDAFVEVDYIANKLYLESRGIDTSTINDAQLKFANTGSKVFLKGKCKILDSMEDIEFVINI